MKWDLIKDIQIPYPIDQLIKKVKSLLDKAKKAKIIALESELEGVNSLEQFFNLNNQDAQDVIAAFNLLNNDTELSNFKLKDEMNAKIYPTVDSRISTYLILVQLLHSPFI